MENDRMTTWNEACMSISEKKEFGEKEMRAAAYALNMCTVSVSQIIDYNDQNILEQEYEFILNNLNLEVIPKDEALLRILKQLLDTISFFRIQEGDKQIIDREYQQKMKNAIWSAAPNLGLVVAGGNPLTMAVSLASQVGIGYMNYRRTKAEASLEREKQMWQLQRTAIEQFNGLRRELFDTAWRLADKYGFPDEYRLTERQIKQYNSILMDSDELRKYERLDYIKEKFEAYPPFWYFFGNTAHYISENSELSEVTRLNFREKALKHFEKYEQFNTCSLLRDDTIGASCALEHIDLLMLDPNCNKNAVRELLKQAAKKSGNTYDILELCAITYARIGDYDYAAKLLRMLVNENYNKVINAQLLSGIYVAKQDRTAYELLSKRVGEKYLFPMPTVGNGNNLNLLERNFESHQKNLLKEKYRAAISRVLEKNTIRWNRITSVFEDETEDEAKRFLDTDESLHLRITKAQKIFSNRLERERFQAKMANVNYQFEILEVLNSFWSGLFKLSCISNEQVQQRILDGVKMQISKYKDTIDRLQTQMNSQTFDLNAYQVSQKITLGLFVERQVHVFLDHVSHEIDRCEPVQIAFLESDLREFCSEQHIEEPEVTIQTGLERDRLKENRVNDLFDATLLGRQVIAAKKNIDFLNEMAGFVAEQMRSIPPCNDEAKVYFRGDGAFDGCFYDSTYKNHSDIRAHAIMIIKSSSPDGIDLIFTTQGVVNVVKGKVKNLTPYREIKLKGEEIFLYHGQAYTTTTFDIRFLFHLIQTIGDRFIDRMDEYIEYMDGEVSPTQLNKWFRDKKETMAPGIVKVYAIPTEEVLSHFGYYFAEAPDPETSLLQCYFKENSGDILGMRIVRFDRINSNFQAMLKEHQGLLRVDN